MDCNPLIGRALGKMVRFTLPTRASCINGEIVHPSASLMVSKSFYQMHYL